MFISGGEREMSKVIYLDTETAGFPEHKSFTENDELLIQLAYATEDNGIMTFQQTYCKNQVDIRTSAMAIHHITPEMLEDKPYIRNTNEYKYLKNEIEEDSYIIAHNAPFDIGIMKREGLDMSNMKVIDTLKIAKFINDNHQEWESLSLGYLKYWFRLDKYRESFMKAYNLDITLTAHDAISDVVDLILLTKKIQKEYNASLEDMCHITDKPLFLKHVPNGTNRGKLFSELSTNQLEWQAENSWDKDVQFTCKKMLGLI